MKVIKIIIGTRLSFYILLLANFLSNLIFESELGYGIVANFIENGGPGLVYIIVVSCGFPLLGYLVFWVTLKKGNKIKDYIGNYYILINPVQLFMLYFFWSNNFNLVFN